MLDRLRGVMTLLWREVAKFGVVGAIGLVIDLGGFDWLSSGPLEDKVTTAKIVSGAVATVVTWLGNRYWTFRHRRGRPVTHEVLLFFAVNGVALGIGALWLALAHYGLGIQGRLANNVNAFIGIGLGTLFRFWAYRRFVFSHEHIGEKPEDQRDEPGSGAPGGSSAAAGASDRKSANRAG